MGCEHIGSIHWKDCETPIGVNYFGLAFEDANYALVDNDSNESRGRKRLNQWQAAIIAAMREGMNSGIVLGHPWVFVAAK